MEKFEDLNYILVRNTDIIPDTNIIIYTDIEGNLYQLNKEQKADTDLFQFEGIAVTNNYYSKAMNIKNNYEEIKSYNDGVRSDDDQYDDPLEWYAYDEYKKYWKEGIWSEQYWKYS